MAHQYHHPLHAVFYCRFSHSQGIEGVNRSCIHQKDKTVEHRDIMMNDETFEALSVEQMKVLNDLGFLIFIVENKKKQM